MNTEKRQEQSPKEEQTNDRMKTHQVVVKHCGKCGNKAEIQTGAVSKTKRGGKASIRMVKIFCSENCGNTAVLMKSVEAAVSEWNRSQIEKHAARVAQAKKEKSR